MAAVSDVEVVRVGPEEWREFREVRLAALADAPGAFGSRHEDWVEADEQRWRSRVGDVALNLLARRDGRPVGLVSGTEPAEPGGSVELISMWVAPGLRGTGLAGRLIAGVVTWAAAHGHPTSLMVRDDNHGAIRSYLRAGFVDLGVPADWPQDEPAERRMRHDGTGGPDVPGAPATG